MLVKCCYHSAILCITGECIQLNRTGGLRKQLLIKNTKKSAKGWATLTGCIVSKLDTRAAQNMTVEQVNSLSNDVLKMNSNHQEKGQFFPLLTGTNTTCIAYIARQILRKINFAEEQ